MHYYRYIAWMALAVMLGYGLDTGQPNVPDAAPRPRDHVVMVSGINKDPDEQQRKMRTVMRFHEFITQHTDLAPEAWTLLVDPEIYMPLDSRSSTAEQIHTALKALPSAWHRTIG